MEFSVAFAILCCFYGISLGETDADGEKHPSRELNVTELDYYVNSKEGIAILEDEFQSIKDGKRRPWTVAERKENVWKNRYSDLYAYDDTRVQLPYDNDSDYINANFIDGYHSDTEYVATQGPLSNTTNDFWAMIWQLNVTKIVMLANLFEHGESKVSKYWPDVTDTYGDIIISKVSEHSHPQFNHVIRTFSLTRTGVNGSRIIRHFHYTGWPDLGVPEDRLSVVALMQQVRSYKPDCESPIVIHCSAGVGRTGTVILLDSMIERAKNEGVVDFPKRLDHMRVQRVDVVEKKEQYVFAHHAVNDLFTNNETSSYLKKVKNEYRLKDYDSSRDPFQEPTDLKEALRQLKWHSLGLQIIVQAIENGFEQKR